MLFPSGKFFTGGSIIIYVSEKIHVCVVHFHKQRLMRDREEREKKGISILWQHFCASRERGRKQINHCREEHVGGSGYGTVEKEPTRKERVIA